MCYHQVRNPVGVGNKDDLGSMTGATEKSSTWDAGTSSLGSDFSPGALAHPMGEEWGDDICSAVRSEAKSRKAKKERNPLRWVCRGFNLCTAPAQS